MSNVWNASTYDRERRRLVPCFDEFYGTVGELIARFCPEAPRILDLGAGTGILSAAIAEREPAARLHLLDASAEMLGEASKRLSGRQVQVSVQPLDAELPAGPYHAIVSALAIHHLDDAGKRRLYARIFSALMPGGLFINAEQICGGSVRLQTLFEAVHLDRARALGSSDAEIAGAIQRMSYDRCSTMEDQIRWLKEIGFEDVDCFYRSFRFAVFGGWKQGA
jgi:tRNA (cmo5U34)-methyltransferase